MTCLEQVILEGTEVPFTGALPECLQDYTCAFFSDSSKHSLFHHIPEKEFLQSMLKPFVDVNSNKGHVMLTSAIRGENKQGISLTLSQTSPGFHVSAVQVF